MTCKSVCSEPETEPQGTGLALTREQAIEIYRHKLVLVGKFNTSPSSVDAKTKGQSAPLAERYGVSPKTIRDIWNRRTWAFATAHLWTEEQPDIGMLEISSASVKLNGVEYRQHRGRPKGSRDKKPRTKKQCTSAEGRHLYSTSPALEWCIQAPLAIPLPDLEWSSSSLPHPISTTAHRRPECDEEVSLNIANGMPPTYHPCSGDEHKWMTSAQSPTACDEDFDAFTRVKGCVPTPLDCKWHSAEAFVSAGMAESVAPCGGAVPCPAEDSEARHWTLRAVSTRFVDPFQSDWPHW